MRPRVPLACVLVTLTLGCGDDTTYADTGDSSDADGSTSSSTSGSGSTSDSTTGDSTAESGTDESTGGTETGEREPYCGDGILDADEECDDGNEVDGDGCSVECESACAAQAWLGVTVDAGWFDIQAMEPGPNNRLVAIGDVEAPGQVGRLRVVTATETSIDQVIEGGPLGSAGTVELPQTHQIDAVARTSGGDVIALGTSTEVLVVDGDPVSSHWLARFDAVDLAPLWRVDIPVDAPELRPLDVAVLGNDDPVVTMTTVLADNDRDLGFERRSGLDGALVWTSSYSGEFNGGWSLDEAGRVVVGPDDRLWAAGIVRVDWQTFETTVIELDPLDGAVLWAEAPLVDTGNTHEQRLWDLSAGPDGRVAVGITVLGPSLASQFGAAFMYTDHELSWSVIPEDLPWADGGPYIQPRVSIDAGDGQALVVGTYTHQFTLGTAARAWVLGLSPEGAPLCAARIGEGNNAAVVPQVGFFAGGRGGVNLDTYGPGGMGPMSAGNWIVTLRGW